MPGRTMKAEVFDEPGRVLFDEKPLRYVALERRARSTRTNRAAAKACGLLIVACLFVALLAWAFQVHAAGDLSRQEVIK